MMMRNIKKAILQNPIVLAAPMQTRLEKRPFTQTILSPKGFKLATVQKVALGILGIPTVLVFAASFLWEQWTLFFISGFMLLLVSLIIWIIKLRAQMVWIVTWRYDSVEVQDGRYGKFNHWVEPLSAFTGLKREIGHTQRSGQYTPNRQVHGLLLVHPDPFKSILLHADTKPISDQSVTYYKMHLRQQLI